MPWVSQHLLSGMARCSGPPPRLPLCLVAAMAPRLSVCLLPPPAGAGLLPQHGVAQGARPGGAQRLAAAAGGAVRRAVRGAGMAVGRRLAWNSRNEFCVSGSRCVGVLKSSGARCLAVAAHLAHSAGTPSFQRISSPSTPFPFSLRARLGRARSISSAS